MSKFSILDRTRRSLGRFARADGGNIAVIFTIALIPLIGFVGAAVDYSRVSAARASMQAALDSTSLMVAKDFSAGKIAEGDIPAKAQAYFNALYTNKDVAADPVKAVYTANASTGSTVQVSGSGSVATDFMKVVGFPNINFSSGSTSTWGNTRMRVAMALDNTGSMASDGKIGALQTASKNLIDQLSGLAKNADDVYISIIPFAKDVNFGSGNYAQTWIDWRDWENSPDTQSAVAGVDLSSYYTYYKYTLPSANNWAAAGPNMPCPFTGSARYPFGCISTSPAPNTSNSASTALTIPSSGYICPGLDANLHKFYNSCWDSVQDHSGDKTVSSCTGLNNCSCTGSGNNKVCTQATKWTHTWIKPTAANDIDAWHKTWTGCFTDRAQPYDTQNTAPTASIQDTFFPADQHYENSEAYCQTNNSPLLQPIMPLSTNWTALKNAITAMQPTGGTNQAVGLAWAWQSLLQTIPMNAPAEDSNYTYNRVIILLSDGLNTENRWPAYGNGVNQFDGSIDTRQQALCTNLKNAKDAKGNAMYTIYTIQVNTAKPADPTSSVLQSCATSSDNFFMLTSASQIVTTFNTIGTNLSKLRVAQ